MKIHELNLNEASYPENLGMVEMFKFYQRANDEQKERMKDLLIKKQFDPAWDLLQKVLGVTLHNLH